MQRNNEQSNLNKLQQQLHHHVETKLQQQVHHHVEKFDKKHLEVTRVVLTDKKNP